MSRLWFHFRTLHTRENTNSVCVVGEWVELGIAFVRNKQVFTIAPTHREREIHSIRNVIAQKSTELRMAWAVSSTELLNWGEFQVVGEANDARWCICNTRGYLSILSCSLIFLVRVLCHPIQWEWRCVGAGRCCGRSEMLSAWQSQRSKNYESCNWCN